MQPRHVTAYEHRSLDVGDDPSTQITSAEAARLVSIGQARRGFCTLGHRSVRLAQYVGLVNLGDRMLEVLPKIGANSDEGECRGTLLRLLRLALDLPVFSREAASHDLRRQSLLDVFVSAFLEAVMTLIRAGLMRRYRTEEQDLGVVRGRLLLQRQATVHAMRVDRLACRFDDLTVDNAWNQVLKATLVAVRPWTRTVASSRRWLEAAAAFDGVSLPADPLTVLGNLQSDRQSKYYSVALHWAGWILRLLSPNLRGGRNRAPELLFDMNRLFEEAVASVMLSRGYGEGLRVTTHDRGKHLATLKSNQSKPFFGLIPDLVLRDDARIAAVADTKWTPVEMDAGGRLVPNDGHVYQLNAYASVYPCEEFALIYPWHEGLRGALPTTYCLPRFGGREPLLHVICLDVGRDDLRAEALGSDAVLSRVLVSA